MEVINLFKKQALDSGAAYLVVGVGGGQLPVLGSLESIASFWKLPRVSHGLGS